MLRGFLGTLMLLLLAGTFSSTNAQIDPEKRRLIQIGFNQPIEGTAPVAAYGFYYYNQPQFYATNLTLRLAIAPIYFDSELGFKSLIGPNTDFAVGLAGGGFADSYSEIRQGRYRKDESFIGHGGEISASIYHLFNPGQEIPLWAVLRTSIRQSIYEEDGRTADTFELPDNRQTVAFRTGLRFGGQEPSLTAPLAMELSVWHESLLRTGSERYGFSGDRDVESHSHLFWTRALLKYAFTNEQWLDLSITAGTSVNADRFSAYRLGGMLPFVSEFPLNIPGYYFQELSAKNFALFNGQYSLPITPDHHWRFSALVASGPVDYLEDFQQPGHWHTGAGAGITFISTSGSWFVTLLYGHGFDAIRSHGRGSNQIGLLFQYDFEAKSHGGRRFIPATNPYGSGAGERLFRQIGE